MEQFEEKEGVFAKIELIGCLELQSFNSGEKRRESGAIRLGPQEGFDCQRASESLRSYNQGESLHPVVFAKSAQASCEFASVLRRNFLMTMFKRSIE